VVDPAEIPLTSPRLVAELLTVAILGREEVQPTRPVRVWVVPSWNVPIALQSSEVPWAICGLEQLTAMETSGEEVTVSGTGVDVTPPREAVMLVFPLATPVAEPVELMVATLVMEDVQVATEVTF